MNRFWTVLTAALSLSLTALPAIATPPPAFTVGDDLYIMGLESNAGELIPILHSTTDIRRNLRANRCGVVRVNRLEELRLGLGSEVIVNGRLYGVLAGLRGARIAITDTLIVDGLPQCQQDGTLSSNDRTPLATLADETVHGLSIIQTLAIPGFDPGERVDIHYHQNILAYHRVNGCGYIQDDADGDIRQNQMTLKLPTGDRTITLSSLPSLEHAPLCRPNGEGWVYYAPPDP